MTTPQTLDILRSMGLDPKDIQHGVRDIEWGWVMKYIEPWYRNVLDFGCGKSPIPLWVAMAGCEVIGVDLESPEWAYRHPNMRSYALDIRKVYIGPFDVIINCSSVEHVGVPGRYGVVSDEPDGDIEVMSALRDMLREDGLMIFTTAIGIGAVHAPLHRTYDRERLSKLFDGYGVIESQFWAKDDLWHITSEDDAFSRGTTPLNYALGLYLLERTEE